MMDLSSVRNSRLSDRRHVASRANPVQATSREPDVLAQRQRTGDIADSLFLSRQVVSHHSSAILPQRGIFDLGLTLPLNDISKQKLENA